MDEIEDRSQILSKINEFYEQNPDGLDRLTDVIEEFYLQLTYQMDKNRMDHLDLLRQKMKKKQDLLDITEELGELQKNNTFVVEMEKNLSLKNELNNQKETIDSGLVRLSQNQDLGRKIMDQQKRLVTDNSITTIKVLQFQKSSLVPETFKIYEKIAHNEKFIMRFILSLYNTITVQCEVLQKIIARSKHASHQGLEDTYKETLEMVKELWKKLYTDTIQKALVAPIKSPARQSQLRNDLFAFNAGSKS